MKRYFYFQKDYLFIAINMNKTISHHRKPAPKINTIHNLASSQVDLELSLSNTFFKHTTDRLFEKQMQVMMESNLLLDTLATTRKTLPKQSKIYQDNESTEDSAILDFTLLQELGSKKTKIFSRKNMNSSSSGIQVSFAEVLADIQQNCSRKTYNTVNNLISEKKKLDKRLSEIDNKDKTSRKRMEIYEKNQQFSLLLQTKNKRLEQQITSLNEKIKDLEGNSLRRSGIIEPTPKTGAFKILNETKKLMEEKQALVNSKYTKIAQIEGNIMKIISENLIEKGCERCCCLIKKLKSSLIGYRNELELWQKQLVKIIQKYKQKQTLQNS